MAKQETFRRGIVRRFVILFVVIVVLGLVGAAGFYFIRYREADKQLRKTQTENTNLATELNAYKTDPNQAAQAEAGKITEEVGKLYALPKDEKPSVATVKDKSKLADQPFFAKAENNDVTLIYSTAKLAILYRPSTKQIINVASVTIQNNQTTSPTSP